MLQSSSNANLAAMVNWMKRVILLAALCAAAHPAVSQSGKVLDRLPFEVVVDVRWQGKDMQVRKVLSCDMRKRMHPGNITSVDPGLKLRDVWEQNLIRVQHVLPTDEVWIFLIPNICSPFNKWLNPLPHGFLPVTYWLDNSTRPTKAEHVGSFRYFDENPFRRFEIRRVSIVESVPHGASIEDEQPLAELLNSRKAPGAYYVGVNGVVIPKSIWAQYPELAQELSGRVDTGLVNRELVQKAAPPLLTSCEAYTHGIGPVKRCPAGVFDDRPHIVAGSPHEGHWKLNYADVGVRRYGYLAASQEIDRTGCNPTYPTCNLAKGTFVIEIDGSLFELPRRGGGVVFDKTHQSLIRIGLGIVGSSQERKIK